MGISFLSGNRIEINRECIFDFVKNCIVDDRMKIMKLMFLLEHYNFQTKKLVSDRTVGNNFIVYKYGPFSFEVYDELIEMIKRKEIIENEKMNVEVDFNDKKIPEEIDEKLHKVIEEFGNLNGKQLETKTLELLGITKEDKSSYFGMPVEVLIDKV